MLCRAPVVASVSKQDRPLEAGVAHCTIDRHSTLILPLLLLLLHLALVSVVEETDRQLKQLEISTHSQAPVWMGPVVEAPLSVSRYICILSSGVSRATR